MSTDQVSTSVLPPVPHDTPTPSALCDDLKRELRAWHEKAMEMWDVTARIGGLLHQAYKTIPETDWPGWLDQVGLTSYAAFCFMKAERYPELMREHKPGSLNAIQRLLPQGQGTAYDAEQAACARRLHDGGMTRRELEVYFGASRGTIVRWLDPEGWAQRQEQRRLARMRRELKDHDARQKKRLAAIKSKDGPGPVAYEHVRKAEEALQRALDDATDRDTRRDYDAALQALYRAEDALVKALKL